MFNLNELSSYLTTIAYPDLGLTDEELTTLFHFIDENDDGSISKNEMISFLHFMLERHQNDPLIADVEGLGSNPSTPITRKKRIE